MCIEYPIIWYPARLLLIIYPVSGQIAEITIQPRTQGLTYAWRCGKDLGALWSRNTWIIQLPRGASKVSNYSVSTYHAKISIVQIAVGQLICFPCLFLFGSLCAWYNHVGIYRLFRLFRVCDEQQLLQQYYTEA